MPLYLEKRGFAKMPKIHGIAPDVTPEGSEQKICLLVMDKYDSDLHDYFLQTRSEGERISVIKAMAGIIKTLHEMGICHRDATVENFVIRNGEVAIIDFGCAVACE